MCPFFWLCVVSFFLFVPYFIIRKVTEGVRDFMLYIDRGIRNVQTKKAVAKREKVQNFVRIVSSDEIVQKDLAEKLYMSTYEGQCLPDNYKNLWYGDNLSRDFIKKIQEMVEKIKTEREKYRLEREKRIREQEEKKRLAMIARKNRINKIVKYAKPIGKILLILLATATVLLLVYLGYLGVVALSHIPTGFPRPFYQNQSH